MVKVCYFQFNLVSNVTRLLASVSKQAASQHRSAARSTPLLFVSIQANKVASRENRPASYALSHSLAEFAKTEDQNTHPPKVLNL